MKSRPTALLVTPVLPNPYGFGLSRRAWNWAMELSREHELFTIVVPRGKWASAGFADVPGKVEIVDAVQSPLPPHFGDWLNPASSMRQAFRAALPKTAPDRIVIFRFYLHPLASLFPRGWRECIEMDCDDWESLTRRSLAWMEFSRGRLWGAFATFTGSKLYASLERRFLPRYRRVHFAAQEDVAAFRSITPGTDVAEMPNRIALAPQEVLPHSGLLPPRLLFVGTFSWLPNTDAVLWIARKVAPLLRKAIPEIRISVAGFEPPQSFSILKKHGVEYAGAPSDLSSYYREGGIALVLLRGGGGSKLKLLEAWMYNRPVVATSHSARGFGAQHEKHLLIADTPQEIVSACVRLLQDPELAAGLVREAHALLASKYLLPAASPRTDNRAA